MAVSTVPDKLAVAVSMAPDQTDCVSEVAATMAKDIVDVMTTGIANILAVDGGWTWVGGVEGGLSRICVTGL